MTITRVFMPYVVLAAVATLAACVPSYPMGLSKAEWQDLSPTERAGLRAQQTALNAARDAALAEEEARETARVDQLYAEAKPGDVVQCAIEGGRAVFGKQIGPYRPLAFRLARGEQKYVSVTDATNGYAQRDLWVQFRLNGLMVDLCPMNPRSYMGNQCFTGTAISRDLATGKTWPLTIPNRFQAATLRCGLPIGKDVPAAGKPSA